MQKTTRKKRFNSTYINKGEGKIALLFLAPSLIGVAIFVIIPFADTIRRSFFDTSITNFIGIDNYLSVLNNEAFQLATTNTLRFIGICIPLLILVSLILALTINSIKPFGKIFKTSFLLPMAIPVASIVLLWQVLFHEKGIINGLLISIGGTAIDFMGSSAVFWVLIFTYIWKNCGYNMILFLAGLDGISENLYEAASVDGANRWQKFRYITFAGLLPTLILTTILSLLNSFKVFREAYLVAGNYPHESIYMLQHLFNNWFRDMDLGRLTACAMLVCILLLGIILFLRRFWKDGDN